MYQIEEAQYTSLVEKIFQTLMLFDEMSLGEMGEAHDTAERIVDEWIEENNIELVK